MNHSLFMAQRFLRSMTREKNIASMLRICAMSIVMSTAALVLIMAIMNGFQKATTSALQGIHSDIILQAPAGGYLDFEKINQILTSEFGAMITSATPFAYQYVIVQGRNAQDISHVVVVQAVDLATLAPSHPMRTMMHWYPGEPVGVLPLGTVMMSSLLTEELQIMPESPLTLLNAVVEDTKRTRTAHTNISLEKQIVRSVGTFKSGIEDFDQRVIFCSLETFRSLFPHIGVTQIGIIVGKNQSPHHVREQLKKRFNLDVFQWQELYPALLDALAIEYTAMILILLLVIGIVSITLSSLLMMYLFYQQTTVALCRSMGFTIAQLRTIFTLVSCVISVGATLMGTLLAMGVSWILDHYQLISLPEVYHITYVPADVPLGMVFLILVIMNSASYLTGWLVTGRIKKMNIALVLKKSGL